MLCPIMFKFLVLPSLRARLANECRGILREAQYMWCFLARLNGTHMESYHHMPKPNDGGVMHRLQPNNRPLRGLCKSFPLPAGPDL